MKALPSSIIPDAKELPPPPPERSIKRKEIQGAGMGHKYSKSELERNDSFHSQKDGKSPNLGQVEPATKTPVVQRKAVPEQGVKKFVSLFELNNGPRGGKQQTPAPTSAPRAASSGNVDAAPSKIPVRTEINQLPPTPPEEKSTPSPPRKALIGAGLPSNPRTKQPLSPLHTRGKSSTGFNILKVLFELPFPSPVFLR